MVTRWVKAEERGAVINGKPLPQLEKAMNPNYYVHENFAYLLSITDKWKKFCTIEVVNRYDPKEGWVYSGSFRDWASTAEDAVLNFEFRHMEFGLVIEKKTYRYDRSKARIVINLEEATIYDQKLGAKSKGKKDVCLLSLTKLDAVTSMNVFAQITMMFTDWVYSQLNNHLNSQPVRSPKGKSKKKLRGKSKRRSIDPT
jgi:hypothetical protein